MATYNPMFTPFADVFPRRNRGGTGVGAVPQLANRQPAYNESWLGIPGLRGPAQQQPGSVGRRLYEMFGGQPAGHPAALGYNDGQPVWPAMTARGVSDQRGSQFSATRTIQQGPQPEQVASGWWRLPSGEWRPPGWTPPTDSQLPGHGLTPLQYAKTQPASEATMNPIASVRNGLVRKGLRTRRPVGKRKRT